MRSQTLLALVAWIWFCTLTPGPHFRAWAQVTEAPLARPVAAGPASSHAALALPSFRDPALPGGILALGGAALPMPTLSPAALSGGLALPAAALPTAIIPLTPSLSVGELGDRASALPPGISGGETGSLSEAYSALGQRFDNSRGALPEDGAGDAAPAGASGEPTASALPEPSNSHPRVVFLLDAFQGPISDRFARYLDTLVDQKVQLVIITDRPESGPGSITEVALSKLKAHRNNGVIVVSHNGGKIFSYTSARSQSHAPLVPNVAGFSEPALQAFTALNGQLAQQFSIATPVETRYEDGKGKNAQVLSYSISLPHLMNEPSAPRSTKLRADRWLSLMNSGLKKAGVPYTFELFEDKDGGLSALSHATPLRGSLGRIREALKGAMNGQDFLADHPEQTLIIADPEWWKSFQRQPELAKVNFLGAKSAGEAESQIGAMLGDLRLEQTYVDRYMLESYVRWKHYQSYKTGGENLDGPSRGGGSRASKDGREMGPMYLWRAAVVSKVLELMGKELRDGSWTQLKDRTLDGYVSALYRGRALQVGSQVYLPYENEAVAEARGKSLWSKYAPGHITYTQRFVQNLRRTLLPLFPMDVRAFAETIHRLGSEATSRTTLTFRNPLTGKMYRVGIRVPLSRLDTTPEGQTFYGHVVRTGKRVPSVDDFTAKMMALALLRADGVVRKGDGWEVNHLPLKQIIIEFHYYRVSIPYVFTPQELIQIAGAEQETTNEIERAIHDDDFQKNYAEMMGDKDKRKDKAVPGTKRKTDGKKAGPRRAPRPAPKRHKRKHG